MKTLIIGAGQVGTALYENLKGHYEVFIRDIEGVHLEGIEVLHICYPEHPTFVDTTLRYVAQYKPKLTIINSSVSVGTTEKLGSHFVYSPVRGRHPNLAKEMRVFAKIVASKDENMAKLAQRYFAGAGFFALTSDDPTGIELMKLLSNIHMGLEIAWRQEVSRILKRFNAHEEDYEVWEETYRNGLLKIGDYNLIRSQMKPGPIGGHCVRQCTEILNDQIDSPALKFILESDDQVRQETKQLKVVA